MVAGHSTKREQLLGMPADLGDILVLGLGKTGRAVTSYCVELLGDRAKSVFVAAGQKNDAALEFLESFTADDFAYSFGDKGVPTDRSFDTCIVSPGIPYWHDLYRAADKVSITLMSELEFAWLESEAASTWIAITGTNGKTTTTALCAHILQQCGYRAAAVGNIGEVCLEAVAAHTLDVYVAEVSSYQLASTNSFAPNVAVILNITPDHLHWHKSLEAYSAAKFKVLENLSATQQEAAQLPLAVLNATDNIVRSKIREVRIRSEQDWGFAYIPLGTSDGLKSDMRQKCGADNAAFLDEKDHLIVARAGEEFDLGSVSDLQILGEHNVSNALAAASAALALGAPAAEVAAALKTFEPLEHRIEPCGSIDGVLYVNDSKGTNVDSVLKALTAFPDRSIVLLLGGEDKGTDLSALVQAAFDHARIAVCFGEAGERFMQAFEAARDQMPQTFKYQAAKHLSDAFDLAHRVSRVGDVILLSPACASFDEFSCFEERGQAFKNMVAALAAEASQVRSA